MEFSITNDTYYAGQVQIYIWQGRGGFEVKLYLNSIKLQEYGKDITFNFEATEVDHGDDFYTDSNGLGMMKRTLNKTCIEPQAGNYYPVTSAIAIRGTTKQLTVVPDRSEGGSVLKTGRIEMMVNRRMT